MDENIKKRSKEKVDIGNIADIKEEGITELIIKDKNSVNVFDTAVAREDKKNKHSNLLHKMVKL